MSANPDSSSSGPCRVQEIRTSEQDHVSKRLRSADNAMRIAREASRQQQHRRGEIGARAKNVEQVLVSELVRALFELAGVEVGIFRRVVLFV